MLMQSSKRGRLPRQINGSHSPTIALENDFKNAPNSRRLRGARRASSIQQAGLPGHEKYGMTQNLLSTRNPSLHHEIPQVIAVFACRLKTPGGTVKQRCAVIVKWKRLICMLCYVVGTSAAEVAMCMKPSLRTATVKILLGGH